MNKKFSCFISLAFVFAIVMGQARAADLIYSTDATVTIGSANYTIKLGSEATSLVIGATTLTAAVPDGSSFTLYSGNRYLLNNDQDIPQFCTETSNQITAVGPVTVVVTPVTTTCTVPQSIAVTPARLSTLATQGFVTASGAINNASYVTFAAPVTVPVVTDAGTASIVIPTGTIVTPTAGGTFNFTQLTTSDKTSTVTAMPSGAALAAAIEYGVPSTPLTFSQAIGISIPVCESLNGRTLNIYTSSTGSGSWTLDTTCIVSSATCSFTTIHASYFAAAEPPPTTSQRHSSGSEGGDGGGGGSEGGGYEPPPSAPSVSPVIQKEAVPPVTAPEEKEEAQKAKEIKAEEGQKKMGGFSAFREIAQFINDLKGKRAEDLKTLTDPKARLKALNNFRKSLVEALDFNGDGIFSAKDLLMFMKKGK